MHDFKHRTVVVEVELFPSVSKCSLCKIDIASDQMNFSLFVCARNRCILHVGYKTSLKWPSI